MPAFAFGGVLVLGVVAALLAVTGVFSGDDKPSGGGSFSDQGNGAPAQKKGPEVVASIPAGADRKPPLIFGMTQNVHGASQPSEILR